MSISRMSRAGDRRHTSSPATRPERSSHPFNLNLQEWPPPIQSELCSSDFARIKAAAYQYWKCRGRFWTCGACTARPNRRKSIIRTFMIAAASAAVFTLSTTAFAQGIATEAKAMLEKAAVAMKADKATTLDTINKGEGGYLDRDLYVFCFNIGDAKVVATGSSNPAARKVMGQDTKTLKDATGKMYGADLYAAAKEGQITEVSSYMFPKPGRQHRHRLQRLAS